MLAAQWQGLTGRRVGHEGARNRICNITRGKLGLRVSDNTETTMKYLGEAAREYYKRREDCGLPQHIAMAVCVAITGEQSEIVKVARTTKVATLPTAKLASAGYDLYASENTTLRPRIVTKVHTHVHAEMPPSVY